MRVLFDQGTPAPLRRHLEGHLVETVFERGWSMLRNGDLLARAEQAGFDVFLTTDQNLDSQQNLGARRLAVVILSTTSWPRIQQVSTMIQEAVDHAHPGTAQVVHIP